MTANHLPECEDARYPFCICSALLACERRIWSRPILAIAQKNGYTEALIDAREAVDSMVIETVGNSAATVSQAVAAIDALREKPCSP